MGEHRISNYMEHKSCKYNKSWVKDIFTHFLRPVSWLHLTFRVQARNLKLWMVLMSGRGLTESNKRCHWINKLHMPWKHRQPISDNIGMAVHKSFLQTMSSNTAWCLSSLKTHVFMGMSLWALEPRVSKNYTVLKLSIHSELILFIGCEERHIVTVHDCSLQRLSKVRGKALDGNLGGVLL